jgi:hypothetical protein
MNRPLVKPSLLHLSVEEENLASVPFAVLERRVGKRVSKIEIGGTKTLPDGTEVAVSWQVQGNSELGLPTEQDLDIFVALGVLTFRNNFSKTVTFTGREIAKILGLPGVHGKFYGRLKLAMDRFIPLRFRGIAESEHHEEVKWVNVFQEASFTLDREANRCVGSITWTDKLIQSMNKGFFRVLDASRYMELDGITAKHLYRFLVVAFEKSDMVIVDARKLATDHVGIINPPKYLSRLMQTLEPALDQLIEIEVLGSYHIVDSVRGELALHRHSAYVPERNSLLTQDAADSLEFGRVCCQKALEKAGLPDKAAAEYAATAQSQLDVYQLERAARLLEEMIGDGVLPHVAAALIRRALDHGAGSEEARQMIDDCEIAVQVCRDKKASGQNVRNPGGLLVKLAKDPEARGRIVSAAAEEKAREMFRRRENVVLARQEESERRALILDYERYRDEAAAAAFTELSEPVRQTQRREKAEILKHQGRLDKLDEAARAQEIDSLIVQDLARKHVPPFEKWYLRQRARQAVLPLEAARSVAV